MKVSSTVTSKEFLRKLAGECKKPVEQKHIVVATEKQDTKEEAIDCAKTYWMMGWTWDEIEVILEDSEYPSDIVSAALKEAKAYAKEILNKGPFAELKAGQLVKLESGTFGTLEEMHQDHATVNLRGMGITKVSLNQLDKVACEKLSKAHDMRMQAFDMIEKLDHNDFSVVASKAIRVESNKSLSLLDQLYAVEQHAMKLQSKLNTISERVRVRAKSIAKVGGKRKELIQLCGAVISQERDTTNEIIKCIADFDAPIAELYEIIEVDQSGLQDVLNSLEDIFTGQLEHLMDASDLVRISEEMLTQEHWSAKDFQTAESNWESSSGYFDKFEENVSGPLNDKRIELLSFIENAKKEDIQRKISAALKV